MIQEALGEIFRSNFAELISIKYSSWGVPCIASNFAVSVVKLFHFNNILVWFVCLCTLCCPSVTIYCPLNSFCHPGCHAHAVWQFLFLFNCSPKSKPGGLPIQENSSTAQARANNVFSLQTCRRWPRLWPQLQLQSWTSLHTKNISISFKAVVTWNWVCLCRNVPFLSRRMKR